MFRTIAIFGLAAFCLLVLVPLAIESARWLRFKYLTLMSETREPKPMATRVPPAATESTNTTDKPNTEGDV